MRRKMGLGVFSTLLTVGIAFGAWGNGTEILGPPGIEIASGTGFALGGTGLVGVPQPAVIRVDVPAEAVVKQVLLYWTSEHYPQSGPDDTAVVNGVEVVGDSIGGPVNFFSVVYFETLRADITGLGLVGPGVNLLQVSGLNSSFRTTGAGVVAVYDDGREGVHTELLDGQDLAYWRLPAPLDTTVPLSFYFEPANAARTATIPLMVGSVSDARSSLIEVIAGDSVQHYYDVLSNVDGPEWDTLYLEAEVPAGVDHLSVQVLSESSEDSVLNPASLSWVVAGIVIEEAGDDCGPCQGGLTELVLQYVRDCPDCPAMVHVFPREWWRGPLFTGTVRPGETISLTPKAGMGTLGPELYVFVNYQFDTLIKTDCSEPIGPGLPTGDFVVVSGVSSLGGPLCPLDLDFGCGPCEGGVTELTVQYLGNMPKAYIKVIARKSHYPLFFGCVNPGGEVTWNGHGPGGVMPKEVLVFVNGRLVGSIDTTCDSPVGPGMLIGPLLVTGGKSLDGGYLCPIAQ